jgi:hypothetical protein
MEPGAKGEAGFGFLVVADLVLALVGLAVARRIVPAEFDGN